MSDLLDEVKQELKEEKFIKLGKTLAPYVLSVMVAIIIGVSAKLWWVDYRNDKIYDAGADYQMAVLKMRAKNVDDAELRFKSIIENNGTIYTPLSQLTLAAFQDFKGHHDDATIIYKATMEKSGKDVIFYDLAKYLQLKAEASIKLDENVKAGLNKYVEDDAVFSSSANDLIVGSEFASLDKETVKHRINALLTDTATPASIRERIKVINSYLDTQ